MSDIVVEIQQGKLRGTTSTDYHGGKFFKFLGIPYAKAPIGELRFKAPQPAEPWSGVRDATKEGPEAPSPDLYFTYFIGSENNCLNLNVYTKELPKDGPLKKPVMVWIHGGGFINGSNKSAMNGPDYLLTQDIVLVATNYRLGILGFASFKDPSLGVPGNAGLKDLRESLRWVQQNIEKFGGDPENVTIFGESAGGAAVQYLTLSPSTKGLFHKAISQSGSALNNWAWGQNNAQQIAKHFGYKVTDEKSIYEKLIKESAKNMVYAQKRFKETFQSGKIRPWGPVVESPSSDAFITEHPVKIMKSQGAHKIPMIIGYNSNEGIFFELVRRTIPGVGLPKDLTEELPYEIEIENNNEKNKVIERIRKEYFNDSQGCNEEDIEQIYKLKGDTNFIYSVYRSIKLQSKHSDQPIYAYRMSLQSSLNYFHTFAMSKYFKTTMLSNFLIKFCGNYIPSAKNSVVGMQNRIPKKEFVGVSHADDLFYLFSTFFTPTIEKGSTEDLYIQKFIKMWTNFAKYGNPTPQLDAVLDNVQWVPVDSNNMRFLEIGPELKMTGDIDKKRLKIWDDLYDSYEKISN
ncbi:hypothetical protein ABEB36_007244 [Hypothenemus hampei]|uniref:Carboxylic ester hydrolase n=1 Tax=Hypothenemus hampei TaxID=57062 RepID=A0ABD1ETB5_HYPHA